MKIIIVISLLSSTLGAQYQFDKVIATGQNNIAGIHPQAIEVDDTIYNFISNTYRYYYGFSQSLLKQNKSGEEISNTYYLDTLDPYDYFDVVKTDNGVLTCGAKKIRIEGKRILLYAALDNKMDTIWTHTITSENNHPGLYKIIKLNNSNIAIVGADTYTMPTGGAVYKNNNSIFILADSLGNILKYTHFIKPDTNSLEGLKYIMQASSGDLYCVGQIQIGTLYNKGLIIKLNRDGEFIWRKEIEQSKFGYDISYSKELSNGNVLLLGSKYKPFFADDTQVWTCVIEIDSSGKILMEKIFYSNYDSNNRKCISDKAKNIICAGAVFYKDNNYSKAYLVKIGPTGDSIWKREFTHGWKDRDEGFLNITNAEDGGYYLTGFNWVQGDNSSKAWIVKVDSNGCVVPGCNTAVNVEKEHYKTLFHLFPNPVGDRLIIYLNDEDQQDRRYMLNCYDQNGRVILTREISGRKSHIDVSFFPSGLYYYQIDDRKRILQNGKLVVR